jgi:putative PIN family toxin of toxin-antitoxin system
VVRVVFDSNVLISALTLPGGQGDRAVSVVLSGTVTLMLSKPILHEVLRVLGSKFSRNSEELARVAVFLGDLAEWVESNATLAVLADEPDNRILECAVAGNAAIIVTGDRAMLDLKSHGNTRIITLRAFLDSMSDAASRSELSPSGE